MKKIIFTFLEVENNIIFDLLFIEQGLKGTQVIKSYQYFLNSLEAFYQNDYSDILHVLQKQISSVKFNKVPATLILASDQIFMERLLIPILSGSETIKTFKLELEKSYGDINNKYVISPVVSRYDKHNNLYKVAFYRQNKFKYIINFLKKLGLSPGKVLIKPEVIKAVFVKTNAIDLKKNILVVNVGHHATDLVTFINGKIDSFMIANGGIDNVDRLLSQAFNITIKEAVELRLNNPDIKTIGKYSTIYDFFEEGLEKAIVKIKIILGAYLENHKIDYLIVNAEENCEDFIEEMLELKLKTNFQRIKIANQKLKKDMNLGALYCKTVNNKNFFF